MAHDTEGELERLETARAAGFPRNPVDMALVLSIVFLLVGAVLVAVNLWRQV